MENIPQKLTDITFSEKCLYLNCLKCKEIPLLFMKEKNPEKIGIKCERCNSELQLDLKDYLSCLSSENLLKNKNNCISHNNYLDRFCYKCHIQFCTKCEINNNLHSDHYVFRLKKMINLEKIEKYKNILKPKKKYFKKYISDYINEKLPKIQKRKYNFIINNLMKPYINSMKNFFLFCDNVLLNYDPEFPDYYQQKNLMNLIELLDNSSSSLISLTKTQLESILFYSNNNFISKNNNNSIINDLIDLSNDKTSEISDALFLDDEFIVLAFKNISLKIYDYNNKNYITAIENNFGEKNIKFKEIKLSQIYKSIFGVILKNPNLSVIKLYSINKSTLTVLFEKQFNTEVKYIKKINNNSLGIAYGSYLEIYSSVDNFENISQKNISKFEVLNKITTPEKIADFIISQDELYIIIACFKKIYIYKSNNFSIFKEIKLFAINGYDINFIDDNKIIYYGNNIGIFTINNSSYKVLFDEIIVKEVDSYLARIFYHLNYSNFVLTFNKLICKRQLERIESTSFEDDEDGVFVEKTINIFDFNPKINTVKLSEKIKNLKVVNIYKNCNDEIIVVQEKRVSILHI